MNQPEGPASYDKTDTTRNYQVSKYVTHEEAAKGELKRMSVGVMLDREIFDKQEQKKLLDDQGGVRSIVANAAGFKPGRDDLKLAYVHFLNPARKKAEPKAWDLAALLPILIPGAMALILTLILMSVIMRQPRRLPLGALPAGALPFQAAGAERKELPPLAVVPGKSFLQVVKEREEMDVGTVTDIENTVSKETDSVAKLIKSWISER